MRNALFLVGAVAVAGSLSCSDGLGPFGQGSRQIAFASRDAENVWDIFVVNADGTGLRNLTESAAEDVYPAWNRARTRIAFRSTQPPGGVFVINADGSGMRHVYNEPDEPDATVVHLSWSPDGRSLAMEGEFDITGRQIRRVDFDGSPPRVLIAGGSAPDWSPDGALIAFHMYTNADHVYVMNAADGTNVRNLTAGRPGMHVDPSWSPDGARIAYAGGGGPNIWVMNADGSDPVQLSTGTGGDRLPVWSRDGTQIAFQRDASIWVMNADGSNQHSVTAGLQISGHPTW